MRTEADPLLAATMEHDAVLDGRYIVEGELGRGSMGVVLRARHRFTNTAVAIKMLRPHFAVDPEVQRRFLDEARVPSAIGHGGIVQVLDAGKTARGELYIVMELLHGRPLRAIALGDVQRIGLELLDALGAAHTCGIVHRDLKPENVFLCDPGGSVKLLDFGIAKIQSPDATNARTAEGTLLGTLAYMAPEQLVDARSVDARADLWAVGVMLYALVAGRLPYAVQTAAEMYAVLLHGTPTPIGTYLPHAPADVLAFFERALSRDPAQRFRTAVEMADVLRRLPIAAMTTADGVRTGFVPVPPVPQVPSTNPASPMPPATSYRAWLAIGLSVTSLALIAAAIVVAARGHRDNASAAVDDSTPPRPAKNVVVDRGEVVVLPPDPPPPTPPPTLSPTPPPPAPAQPSAKRTPRAAAAHTPTPPPPAPPERAAVAESPAPSSTVWAGRYTCAQGATALRLAIDSTADTVTAIFSFGPLPENPNVRRGSYRMVGRAHASGEHIDYDLRPAGWIDQPDGYTMVGLSATADRTSVHGTIRAAGCGALDATLVGSQ
jgi:serine/threonine protein kinase